MLSNQCLNLLPPEHCKYLQVLFCVLVRHIEPELIKFIRSGSHRIEPDIALLCLSKFTSIRFGNQGPGEGKGLSPFNAPDQFGSGNYISPLVGASHL